ncbi:unnamed protein product [Cuscuta epithymum]|uniref:Ubiquitin carboxyl-terminal hydrolase n=1 Tax=Cuscuta epithymum TaxID=186058 RepID=A0AAV0G6G6_9ASTE|nr:unnamed protein product [Cuscuta epithymum]
MKIHGITAHKLRHGLQLIARSAPGLQVSLAATILGVAGLAYAVKDIKFLNLSSLKWSSGSNTCSDDSMLLPGLQNFGNNCFLNAVLQALASCQSFRNFLEELVSEVGGSSTDGSEENSSLADALFWLLEELCTLQHGRTVLSPQKLMHAMNEYIPNFNMTSQQDAEEALYHLLSSLREELSESYVHECISLADVTGLPNCRVLDLKKSRKSEPERWRQYFIGPFYGILCSSLMCQSCSLQISLDFQLFQSLHLLPRADYDGSIVARCRVEDCLRRFLVAEQLESYYCSHCWHIAAIKYASKIIVDEIAVKKLKLCQELDSCDCKEMSCLRALPWSNEFSRTFKQFSIAHSPQILCIHLQRASINAFGESVKLQGHISYPLILDMSPFTKTQLGTKECEGGQQISLTNCIRQRTGIPSSYAKDGGEFREAAFQDSNDKELYSHSGSSSASGSYLPYREKHIYRLVSVVQHYGRVGSGHYIVYRRVAANTKQDSPAVSSPEQWYCMSDSEVHAVSEKDVLDAEASLLFYEKVPRL